MIPKLETNRFLARLIVIILTTHPEYKSQFIELGSELITLGFGGGKYKYYNVKRVKKEMIENRTLYSILCGNEDQGEEFNFSFFADFAGTGVIHFKNKPQVAWDKQATDISFNDNSNTQNRH